MKKPAPKKPNPVAKGLRDHKPQVVPDKTRYSRKEKHKKEDQEG